jgi:hypothetical protein
MRERGNSSFGYVTSHKFVSKNYSTAATRVRIRAEHVGFVVDKAALGQIFSEYFGFLCQSSFHQFLHHNHPADHSGRAV